MKAKWLIATALVALLVGGIGTAGAKQLLSGKDIQDRTLHGRDIARGTVSRSNLTQGVQDLLNNGSKQQTAASQSPTAGATGAAGPKGDKGDKGDHGDKGDKGDQGDQGAPGATTLVTPFQNFETGKDTPGPVWADDQFACDFSDNGSGSQGFVNGVSQTFSGEDTPVGSGAYQFLTTGKDTAHVVHLNTLEGLDLADLENLRYSEIFTNNGAGTPDAVYVQIRVDRDGDGPGTDVDTLFFIPANQNGFKGSPAQGPVKEGVWQTWNVTLPGAIFGIGGDSPTTTYVTLAQYLQQNPNATLKASDFEGAIRLVGGCGQNTANTFKAAVDNVVVSPAGGGEEADSVIYDFEAS